MSLDLLADHRFIESMNLPEQVKLVEVGPRDGLQNQPRPVSIEEKTEFIDRLSDCGFSAIETGSLVSPRLVPQMADSETVYQKIDRRRNTDYIMLVPNQKGLERAIDCRLKTIAVFCAATDAFSLKNIHCTVNESLEIIQRLCEQAKAREMAIRGYISCTLGCPYQGKVDLHRICQIAESLYEFGCDEISLGDTIGVGTPGMVAELLSAVSLYIPADKMAVHFHDTYGQALANILTALQCGVHVVDCSVSGLGGCPFAPGASGNVASEDVVYLLNGLGIKTGIDLDALISTGWFISGILQRQPASRVSMALVSTYTDKSNINRCD